MQQFKHVFGERKTWVATMRIAEALSQSPAYRATGMAKVPAAELLSERRDMFCRGRQAFNRKSIRNPRKKVMYA